MNIYPSSHQSAVSPSRMQRYIWSLVIAAAALLSQDHWDAISSWVSQQTSSIVRGTIARVTELTPDELCKWAVRIYIYGQEELPPLIVLGDGVVNIGTIKKLAQPAPGSGYVEILISWPSRKQLDECRHPGMRVESVGVSLT